MQRVLDWLTNLFPLWALLGGALALVEPRWFTWFSGEFIVWGLAIIMLGMGITLSVDDFKRVFKMPKAIAAGFLAQYSLMPFLGWAIASALPLEKHMAVGLILVACCPGGTASNVVTFLAKADVPLSVLMTMCSTFAAVVMTPLLTKFLAGALVPVDAMGLFLSTVKVVLLPLVLGLALPHFTPKLVTKVLPAAPLVSVVFITLIVASVIGQNAKPIRESGGVLLLAVFLLHACGFGLGYLFAKLFGYDKIVCRTISIEVGMQNSGLGVVLARKHFPDTLAPVPCAVSSVFHSVIGSLLAAWWRWQAEREAASKSGGGGQVA
ncbi:MAG: bile acid:Na+ symporter BASS family [Limisphaerales bacterium]|nr:MAG: bile acid:Na+ symporter BASS family [Limisphaerales bacterium]KAG0508290.1 MAG: bile acid:Na+ symporter BASS family [Limisphaerales bacterium]TXT49605.1 MAG: bile acid:Na+ symporter BASS family [Limisphaerales bacterium]